MFIYPATIEILRKYSTSRRARIEGRLPHPPSAWISAEIGHGTPLDHPWMDSSNWRKPW